MLREGGQREHRGRKKQEKKKGREREGARHQVGWIHQGAKSCDNWLEGCRSPPARPPPPSRRRRRLPHRGRSSSTCTQLPISTHIIKGKRLKIIPLPTFFYVSSLRIRSLEALNHRAVVRLSNGSYGREKRWRVYPHFLFRFKGFAPWKSWTVEMLKCIETVMTVVVALRNSYFRNFEP